MALQLALPLRGNSRKEAPLRHDRGRSGVSPPSESAPQDRALALCLRCLTDASHCRHRRKRRE